MNDYERGNDAEITGEDERTKKQPHDMAALINLKYLVYSYAAF